MVQAKHFYDGRWECVRIFRLGLIRCHRLLLLSSCNRRHCTYVNLLLCWCEYRSQSSRAVLNRLPLEVSE